MEAHGLARSVRVVADAEAAHRDAFDGGPGVLVTAGTGSVAWGTDDGGRVVRVGGWGPLVGDEGSGYILALEAVRAVLRARDGRGPETALTAALLDATNAEEPEELVDWVAREDRAEVAELAPVLMDVADAEDPVATSLVDEGGRALTAHLDAILQRLGGPVPEIAFGGSLLRPGTPLRRILEEAARKRGGRVVAHEVSPARGAARIALSLDEG